MSVERPGTPPVCVTGPSPIGRRTRRWVSTRGGASARISSQRWLRSCENSTAPRRASTVSAPASASPTAVAQRFQHRLGVASQPVTHVFIFDPGGHYPLYGETLVALLQ